MFQDGPSRGYGQTKQESSGFVNQEPEAGNQPADWYKKQIDGLNKYVFAKVNRFFSYYNHCSKL